MTYATAADVAALLARELDDAETALAERRLAQVERMILRRIPDLADQIEAEHLDQADVIDIEAEAVYRVMRDGDGIVSESDGNYTYQKRYDSDFGKLTITDEEWSVLGVKRVRVTQLVPSIGGRSL